MYFFFQAEDGIRYWSVTGVQTCALPIYRINRDQNSYLSFQSESGNVADEVAGFINLPHPSLAVATSHQDVANGMILIWRPRTSAPLMNDDIGLIQEFADQVGTGIAHASLFTASQDLAVELRRTNGRLIQKHHELEEAHQRAEADRKSVV